MPAAARQGTSAVPNRRAVWFAWWWVGVAVGFGWGVVIAVGLLAATPSLVGYRGRASNPAESGAEAAEAAAGTAATSR